MYNIKMCFYTVSYNRIRVLTAKCGLSESRVQKIQNNLGDYPYRSAPRQALLDGDAERLGMVQYYRETDRRKDNILGRYSVDACGIRLICATGKTPITGQWKILHVFQCWTSYVDKIFD